MAIANCNQWLYAKRVYNIGRTERFSTYAFNERRKIYEFIEAIMPNRLEYDDRVTMKIIEILDEDGNEVPCNVSLSRMIQVIGRSIKVHPLSEEEKTLCDQLFEATGGRKDKVIDFKFAITLVSEPAAGGQVGFVDSEGEDLVSDGLHYKGEVVYVKAVPADGYSFSEWDDESTDNPRQVIVSEDLEIVATFTED